MTGAREPRWKTWLLVGFAAIGVLSTVLDHGWSAVSWATGGLKPLSQVATDQLTTKVDTIQTDVSDIKQTLKSLPHSYEFEEQRVDIKRLDQAAAGLDGRVTALERAQTQFRNPKN